MAKQKGDEKPVDVLIIGGGIYGCGVAQAVAASGYSVTLVEKNTIASGTSHQSTKLIHGGLRYLEQGHLKLVYAALSERETLLNIAPDLVQREWFYIPIYEGARHSPWLIGSGLLLYWLLSRGRSRFRRIPHRQWRTVLPGLNNNGLRAVLAYQDAATDDAALTRAVAASAQSFGCNILENHKLQRAEYIGEHGNGHWQVRFDNRAIRCARILVNASGPWMDETCRNIRSNVPDMPHRLIQGSHLLLDRACPAYIYSESTDRRVMFFRPWRGRMLVGTTETELAAMPDKPAPTQDEIEAILSTYNHYFPDTCCTDSDILDTYCGVRVLPCGDKAAFAANRETVILADNEKHPAYIGIYGGKLTTYRREAEKVLRLISRSIPAKHRADTRHIKLRML
ncbi:MAG: FAD-dependent oxidoreductase [Mariprofundaceae bacterium]|nr:FAD-dependent oxidoreductase [Mariprofundaceae bacterium]